MFSEEEMPQGSPEWLDWRKRQVCTASGDALKAIVGAPSSFEGAPQTHDDVRNGVEREWTDEAEQFASFGRRHEPAALAYFNELADTGLTYAPCCIEVPVVGTDKTVGASLDGYAWDAKERTHRFVEIKCPAKLKSSGTWRVSDDGKVPDWYLWQTAFQMYCLEGFGDFQIEGVFFVFIPRGRGGPDYRAVKIDYELHEEKIEHIHDRLFRFIQGQPPLELWHQTPAGIEERKKKLDSS